MEDGNSFDSANIEANFATPFVTLNDPQLRKTIYKLHLYTDPIGSVEIDSSLIFDFDTDGVVQPAPISLTNTSSTISVYGDTTSTYGTATYGGKLKKVFTTQTIGSGFNVSLNFLVSDTNAPFSLDASILEYAIFDRR